MTMQSTGSSVPVGDGVGSEVAGADVIGGRVNASVGAGVGLGVGDVVVGGVTGRRSDIVMVVTTWPKPFPWLPPISTVPEPGAVHTPVCNMPWTPVVPTFEQLASAQVPEADPSIH
jgi:hypothetical protein